MQYSTKITDRKQIDELHKSLKSEYPSRKTDLYLTMISDKFNINTYGDAIEFATIELGADSQHRRLDRIKLKIEEENQKVKTEIDSLENEIIQFNVKIKELEANTDLINTQINEINKSQSKLKKAYEGVKSIIPRVNYDLKDLNRTKINNLQSIDISRRQIGRNQKRKIKILEQWENRKEIYESSLIRSDASAIIMENRLKRLYTDLTEIEKCLDLLRSNEFDSFNSLEELLYLNNFNNLEDNSNDSNDEDNSNGSDGNNPEIGIRNPLILKLIQKRQKIQEDVSDRLDLAINVQKTNITRAFSIEKKRLQSEISKLERKITATGYLKERYFIQRTFKESGDRGGDLVAFSRQFDSTRSNIEGEMTHSARVVVDPEEAQKTMLYLLYITIGLNFFFFATTTILGIIPNLINKDTFYVGTWTLYVLYQNTNVQDRDKIFEAFYYWLDSSYIDVQFKNEKGEYKTIRMLCYHIDLLYSDQKNLFELFNTTEAEILASSDERLHAKVERLEAKNSALESELIASDEERENLISTNQQNLTKIRRAKTIAMNDLKSDDERKKALENQKQSDWIPVVQNLFKYGALIWVAFFVTTFLSGISGPKVFIEGSQGIDFGSGVLLGFLLGFFTKLLLDRWSRSR